MGEKHLISKGEAKAAHTPVMLKQVLKALAPVADTLIVDATFGAGGYSRALLKEGASVIAIDRDPGVLPFAEELLAGFGERFRFVAGQFSRLDELVRNAGENYADAVVLDIGVSSMQLDEKKRGFSFVGDGPLDMRMSGQGQSAADIVNTYEERALADLLFAYGEERRSRRIAKAICLARAQKPIETTLELARLIEKTIGRKPGANHPATRSFQALRIAVNREMDELVKGLFAAERLLKEGGVLAVVSFHSLEDRIVKRFFDDGKSATRVSRHMPRGQEVVGRWGDVSRAQKPDSEEIADNPRARSAVLRFGRRSGQEARKTSYEGLGVPGGKLMGAQ
ncbi:16S rRNA (cytosine(1402)-N(4))-methyltransferase [hydrothermal vent metagenome]|uniref:16S rRNA (Cytosine(1402)-N(4))-methyltransferase n=1 Tax=hydrothermal vent metagenome TaxID=652676 RepID=A0A3B0TJH3_9ZZZZ